MKKIYCYVDETGQDTQGRLFIVSVVITEEEKEVIENLLEKIETDSGKGRVKWVKSNFNSRLTYIRRILSSPLLRGKISFAFYQNNQEYLSLTVLTTARAILGFDAKSYKATIFVDGLPRSQERWFGRELRHLRIKTKKARGVKRDENNPIIRLADAICGFVRAAIEGRK